MSLQLSADATGTSRPLNHFWSRCVGAGRANEGLRAGWLEQLDRVVHDCGFQFIRFHGLYHDDMFVYREVDGVGVYNFQYIDDLFDRLLAAGIRPFVEFGFCPGDLASKVGTVFWWKGNGAPPKDYAKWGELVRRTVEHWVARYGIDEVREWYFEIWNEPNLWPFFDGTRSQYFELYKVSVEAIKGVDGALRVGGPATSNFVPDARFSGEREDKSQHELVVKATDLDALEWRPVWVEAFLEYCEAEGLPVDFISTHPYPTDWALDALGGEKRSTRSVDSTRIDLTLLRKIVDGSAFPKAEIHLTEWSSSPSPRDHTHDHLPAAAFVVKTNLESAGLVDSLSYWTFTDVFEEGGGGGTAFHGGFGMVNYQGIVKPTFHAYRFLHALGDEVLAATTGAVITRSAASGKVSALVYHYPDEVRQAVPGSYADASIAVETLRTGTPRPLLLEITDLPPGATIQVETLDESHGNVVAALAGEPVTREETQRLRAAAEATRKEIFHADAAGRFALERTLAPWSLVSITQLA